MKLATLLVTDVRLCVCADESLNGHDNVVGMINRLDDGTEVPTDLRCGASGYSTSSLMAWLHGQLWLNMTQYSMKY